MNITITSAELAFGAATVLIAITLVVLNYAWKTLGNMLSSLPEGQRRVRFNLRNIRDDREKDKAVIIMFHFIGCMSFAVTIVLSVTTIIGVASVMFGYKMGFYQYENYEFGRSCLFWGIGFFGLGMYATGLTYIGRIISVITGKPDMLTTDLSILPTVSADAVAKRRTFERIYFPFFILLVVLLVLDVFDIWVSILISVVAFTLAYLAQRILYKLRHR